uniref:Uncharacterized protein n=1 Tax=Heterorhabditis bacteriophora TaxID=37862 RepID=A0A1I7X6X3_HETBA
MEQSLGKYALDDSYDEDHLFIKTPLENLYAELGMKNPETALYRQFPVYIPKQSSEYFAISHGADRRDRNDSYRGSYSSYRERADDEYEKNNKKTLIDYKDFDSSPLSPYLYQSHPYVRPQDSRIVGSNFVQVETKISE